MRRMLRAAWIPGTLTRIAVSTVSTGSVQTQWSVYSRIVVVSVMSMLAGAMTLRSVAS